MFPSSSPTAGSRSCSRSGSDDDAAVVDTDETYVTEHVEGKGHVNRLLIPFNPIPSQKRVVTGPWDGAEATTVEIDIEP